MLKKKDNKHSDVLNSILNLIHSRSAGSRWYTQDFNTVSTDIKNLSDRGPDQNKKTTDKTGDIITDLEKFEFSIDFFLKFRLLGTIGCANGLQALLPLDVS
jgi:hypothetical protein